MVEDFYNRDFTESIVDDKTEMSQDELWFMQNAKETVKLKDSHYQICLPFKDNEASVPSNKSQALQRTNWLKKKLERDPRLYEDYKTFMADVVAKGYARKVPLEQMNLDNGKVWYILHHGVYHPYKPGKIPVVFDCSAKFNSVSLNSMLYKYPDLTNSLFGVLTRFRQDRIAVTADIQSMFYQVRVSNGDSSFLSNAFCGGKMVTWQENYKNIRCSCTCLELYHHRPVQTSLYEKQLKVIKRVSLLKSPTQ